MVNAIETKTSDVKKKNNTTLYVVIGAVSILAIVGCIIGFWLWKRKKSTTPGTTTPGTTTPGTTTPGTTTPVVNNTDETSLAKSSNLRTWWSNSYKYYLENGALAYFPRIGSGAPDASDSAWKQIGTFNIYTEAYGKTNSLMSRYLLITCLPDDVPAALEAGTSGARRTYSSIMPAAAGVTPVIPKGFTLISTMYAFSPETVSSNDILAAAVAAGKIVPISVYGSAYVNGTVIPAVAVVANTKDANYTVSQKYNGATVNVIQYPKLMTFYASSNQTAIPN